MGVVGTENPVETGRRTTESEPGPPATPTAWRAALHRRSTSRIQWSQVHRAGSEAPRRRSQRAKASKSLGCRSTRSARSVGGRSHPTPRWERARKSRPSSRRSRPGEGKLTGKEPWPTLAGRPRKRRRAEGKRPRTAKLAISQGQNLPIRTRTSLAPGRRRGLSQTPSGPRSSRAASPRRRRTSLPRARRSPDRAPRPAGTCTGPRSSRGPTHPPGAPVHQSGAPASRHV